MSAAGARPKRMAPTDPKWEFPRSKLKIQKKLGEGAYGEVWRGTAADLGGAGTATVAVKFLRGKLLRNYLCRSILIAVKQCI